MTSANPWRIYGLAALIAIACGTAAGRWGTSVPEVRADSILWASPRLDLNEIQQEEGLKIGFIRSDIILQLHPSVPDIRSSFEEQILAWQSQQQDLTARGETLQMELRTAQLSPVQRRSREEELQRVLEELAAFQTEMWSAGGRAEQKEQELMQPVFDEIDAVIRDIAEGSGYDLIFDASAGGLLFGHVDLDLTRIAMEKLGIEAPEPPPGQGD
jgi:outer membrane protein